jgi:hypothetical protein
MFKRFIQRLMSNWFRGENPTYGGDQMVPPPRVTPLLPMAEKRDPLETNNYYTEF